LRTASTPMVKGCFPPIRSLIPLPVILFFATSILPVAAMTEDEMDAICGAKGTVSRASVGSFVSASRQSALDNLRVEQCRQQLLRSEAINSLPTGSIYPDMTVNGYRVRKCSHGGPCMSDIMLYIKLGERK